MFDSCYVEVGVRVAHFKPRGIGRCSLVSQGKEGGQMKVPRSVQILAVCLGLWSGLVLVLASSVGWQIALPVLVVGVGGALVFASFLSYRS